MLAASMLCLVSCDVNRESPVPNARVSLKLNLSTEYVHFTQENTTAYLTFTERRYSTDLIGYAGILVYVGTDAQYHAYDLCCPHCVKKAHPLEVDGLYAVCPLCGERYEVCWGIGQPTKGISQDPMRCYNISKLSTQIGTYLIIRN